MRYRREIDGLRALAVVPVVLFHGGIEVFSGGYVGVDVFFVISGFLITGILLEDVARGRFSIASFYARRARRILPALLVVLLASAVAAWIVLLPDELRGFSRSVVAVLGFCSNVLFWREQGYFTDAAELKPLLHTWSLAVEEQFYLAFPLVVFVLARYRRRTAVAVLAAMTGASFVACEVAAVRWPTANFYLAPTRAWELLAGALCAYLTLGKAVSRGEALPLLGLGLILAGIFWLSASTPFPSRFALLPVGGTVLILLFAGPRTLVGRLLGLAPLVGIGLVSYSLYLWHQPLYAFARLASPYPLAPSQTALLALAALGLAIVSWRFVEKPFRRPGEAGEARRAVRLAVLATVPLVALGVYGEATDGTPGRLRRSDDPGVTALAASANESATFPAACREHGNDAIRGPCWLVRAGGASRPVAMFGDSHALALSPGFAAAGSGRGVAVLFAASGGCPPLLGAFVFNGNGPAARCPELARRQFAAAIRQRVEAVYLVGRWSLYTDGDPLWPGPRYILAATASASRPDRDTSRRVFASALARTVAAYRQRGIRVVLVEQVPQQRVHLARLIRGLPFAAGASERLVARLIAQTSVTAGEDARLKRVARHAFARASAKGAEVLTLDQRFAAGDRFVWGALGQSWYSDESHLSPLGARRVASLVETTLPGKTGANEATPLR
ncbi:MAG: acyltransferase family protein [Novosphingobium sp.]